MKKIDPAVLQRATSYAKRLSAYRKLFAEYVGNMKTALENPKDSLGASVEIDLDNNQAHIRIHGIELKCKLMSSIRRDGQIVYIAYFTPDLIDSSKSRYLGRIIFNSNGQCDDILDSSDDPIYVQYYGEELTLEFAEQALKDIEPEPRE
jgi:hypothetical protein